MVITILITGIVIAGLLFMWVKIQSKNDISPMNTPNSGASTDCQACGKHSTCE